MTVGVTGAAGFLGANLVAYLHGLPDAPRIVPFVSRRRGNPLTDGLGLRPEHLDVTSRDQTIRATRGLDALVHVAGRVSFARRDRRSTWDINVLGTRNVLEAAVANGIGRLVCVSSINVLGAPPDGCPVDETNDPYSSLHHPISFASRKAALAAVDASLRGDYAFLERVRVPYFDSKLAAHELVGEYHRRHGLGVVLALPGTAVGPGDSPAGIAGLVERVYESRLAFTLPGGTAFVSAADVARGLWLCCSIGREGEPYLLTGGERGNLSYRAFMELVAGVVRSSFGRRCRRHFLAVPPALARLAGRAAETFVPDASLTEGLALSGSATHRFSCAKATRELGYEPRVSLEDSIRACIEFILRRRAEGSP